MRRAVRCALLAAALIATAAPAARAAGDKAIREAQARFEEGIARVRAGDFEAARVSFAEAYAVIRKPDILWNLALSEEKSGHLLEALGHFKQAAREAVDDSERVKAQKHVDVLMGQTGHLEVLAPPGTQLALDGVAAGVAPLSEPLDVAPGKHRVESRSLQGLKKTTDADVVTGQVAHVSFMTADTSAPPAATIPEANAAVPSASTDVQPVDASPRDATDHPKTFWTSRMISVVAVGGSAVAGLGLGVLFGLQSQSDASTATAFRSKYPSDACAKPTSAMSGTCAQWNDAVKGQNREATLSNVFYVAGAVLAAGAVATWFLWPKETRGGVSWVLPVVSPAGGGIGAGGTF
jgi:hypothetical protein